MEGMAQPGWYPDPSGSGTPRYWDGTAWSPPPGSPEIHGSGNHRRSLLGVGVGVVAILLVVTVVLWQPWRPGTFTTASDTNSSKPTGSQWNELEPTETPSSPQPTDGDGRPVACPYVDADEGHRDGAWYASGPAHFRGVPGWQEEQGGWTIDFATERSGQQDRVKDGWVSITAIGQLSTEDFSADPRAAATQVSDCLSSSFFYRTLERRERLQDEEFTTPDGLTGWIIRENYWNVPDQPVSGDEVVVVVLSEGNEGALTIFHSQAPIEDQRRKDKVAEALSTLSRS